MRRRILLLALIALLKESSALDFPAFSGDCDNEQIFAPDHTYQYQYEGSVTSPGPDSGEIQINCVVNLVTYQQCSAKLHFSSCTSSNSQWTRKFVHKLERANLYFNYNGVKILRVLHHPNEKDFIVNLKKAIIVRLFSQLERSYNKETWKQTNWIQRDSNYDDQLYRRFVNFEKNNVSETFDSIDAPWDSFKIRIPGVDTSLLTNALPPYKTLLRQHTPVQETCKYKYLISGPPESVVCDENIKHPRIANIDDHLYNMFQMEWGENAIFYSKIELTYITSAVNKRSISGRERNLIRRAFTETSIKFNKKPLDESSHVMHVNFDAASTILKVVRNQDPHQVTPYLTRLEQWVVTQDADDLYDVWSKVEEASSFRELRQAQQVWNTLLFNCVDEKWCQDADECKKRSPCYNVITNNLQRSYGDQRKEMLHLISKVKHPNSQLIGGLLHASFNEKTVDWFVALEKLVTNHLESDRVRRNNNMVNRAKTEVFETMQTLCGSDYPDADHMVLLEAGILSMASFNDPADLQSKNYILQTCWRNVEQSQVKADNVVLALVKVTSASEIINIQSERSRLMGILSDASFSSEARLSSFLALITNSPRNQELSQMVQLARSSQSSKLAEFMKDFMRSQVSLRESDKSFLSTNTLNYLRRAYSDVVPLTRDDKTYTLPVVGIGLNFNLKIVASLLYDGQITLPKIIELHAAIPELGLQIIDIEIQTGGIQLFLDRLVGPGGVFPLDLLNELRSRPMTSWIRSWFEEAPALNKNTLGRIQQISKELNFFKTLNEMAGSSLFSVKLFGKELNGRSVESLFDLTAGQVFHLLEQLEQGIERNDVLHFSPFMARIASFTPIGLPVVTTQEISVTVKSVTKLVADISKLFFTSYSENTFTFAPHIEISALLENYVSPYKGISAGSGSIYSLTSEFETKLKLITSPTSFRLTIEPGMQEDLFLLRQGVTGMPWKSDTGVQVSTTRPCRPRARPEFFWIGVCSGSSFGIKSDRPKIQIVFLGEKDEMLIEEGSAYGYSFYFFMQDAQTGRQLMQFSPSVSYNPSKKIVQLDISVNNAGSITLLLGFDHQFNEVDGMLDQLDLSLNMSFNSYFSKPIASGSVERVRVRGTDLAYRVQVTDSTNNVQVNGQFLSYGDSQYEVDIESQMEGITLGGLFYETRNLRRDSAGQVGKNVTISVKAGPMEHKFSTAALSSARLDTYDKVIHYGVLNGDNYYFVDGRMNKLRQDPSNPGKYEWHATITTPIAQGQWNVDALQDDYVEISADFVTKSNFEETFKSLQQNGLVAALDNQDVRLNSVPMNGLTIRFTNQDAYALESNRPATMIIISQKPDCSPCAKVVLYGPRAEKLAEVTMEDDGRSTTLQLVTGTREVTDHRFTIDRYEKSIEIKSITQTQGQYTFKLNMDEERNVLELSVERRHDDGTTYSYSNEIIDPEPDNTDLHPLGVLTHGSLADSCVVYESSCDPLPRICDPAAPDCVYNCQNIDNDIGCCSEQATCPPGCQDYDCGLTADKVGRIVRSNLNIWLYDLPMLYGPDLNWQDVYLRTKALSFLLSQIEDVQTDSLTSRYLGQDINLIKRELRTIFEKIYFGELLFAEVLSDPPKLLNDLIRSGTDLYRSQTDAALLEPYQGAAFVTSENGQFITMNGNYHNIPSIPLQSCSWLASTDTIEGSVNVIMKRDSTVYTIGEESVEITMDGRAFWSPDGSSRFHPIDFPFFFKVVTCSKPSENVIECKGMYSHARFVYYPGTGVTTIYGDMRGSIKHVQGAIGFPLNTTSVPQLLLPDGGIARNEEQFLNSYELSGDHQCLYNTQTSTIDLTASDDVDVCVAAFEPFLKYVQSGAISNEKLHSYVKACGLSATTHQETCHYTDMLAFSLRKKGIPCAVDTQCLPCNNQGSSAYINRLNVAFIVSLSEDTQRMDVAASVEDILAYIEDNAQLDVSYSLVTFGGEKHLYSPNTNSFNYRDVATDRTTFKQHLDNLAFDGPAYDISSMVEALKYTSQAFQDMHQGVYRSVVVIAPQENTQDIGMLTRLDARQMFSGTWTPVNFVSMATPDDSIESSTLEDFFGSTDGGTFRFGDRLQLARNLVTKMQASINQAVDCRCQMSDLITGDITFNCDMTAN